MNKFSYQRTAVNAAEDVRKLNERLESQLDGPTKDSTPLDTPTAAVFGQLVGEMQRFARNYQLIVSRGYENSENKN